jgi:putative transposase
VYQGRFKAFPIQEDEHFYTVARYVERNARRANLVRRAERWPWSGLHRWQRGTAEDKALLAAWPLPRKASWVEHVNAPQAKGELEALRRSVQRGSPFGDPLWSAQTVRKLGLESTVRPQGRPKKS